MTDDVSVFPSQLLTVEVLRRPFESTLYPQLIKLEQEGCIAAEWSVSENGRKAKFYRLTRVGCRQLVKATQDWEQANAIVTKFLAPEELS